ncbi:HlyD family secretion protein [Saccharophagus degradans]|uniref:HlyD family secretion protein n=1 Tax=Saccharophagus degradans TaxID=86304 RepID=A0AAW7X9X6_9GAMM|nr:HlyD family secretion protein [Saccharophagus degradans]MDO6423706.1 HlyD family secretion protein [Saccharophagus degradans]MDO6607623.1 HlyD family secretion protein [Saccharophagus degradans]
MKYLNPLLSDHRYQVGLVIFVVVLTISSWSYATRNVESTDNATVQCDLIDVVSEVNGVIDTITFTDDQWIEKTGLAVKIEDSLFVSELKRSEAALAIEQASYIDAQNNLKTIMVELDTNIERAKSSKQSAQSIVDSMDSSIEEARQELIASKKDMTFLEENFNQISRLYKQQMVSETDYKNAKRQFESKQAMHSSIESKINRLTSLRDVETNNVYLANKNLEALETTKDSQLKSAKAKVDTALARVNVAQAEYDLAALNLERTNILAKRSGFITNRRISSGDYIEIGQPIASIVSCQDKPWIQANFKETQVGKMQKGQKVEFTIDTYPEIVFEGYLESISSGSGSTFSVLPPENATGNFTKVVKRMPVKISIAEDKGAIFRIGASANVKVFTR